VVVRVTKSQKKEITRLINNLPEQVPVIRDPGHGAAQEVREGAEAGGGDIPPGAVTGAAAAESEQEAEAGGAGGPVHLAARAIRCVDNSLAINNCEYS
jgi:hypothetical protein